MTEEQKKRCYKLADDHWGYTGGVIEACGASQEVYTAAEFAYIEWFFRGYKAGIEDNKLLIEWDFVSGFLQECDIDISIYDALAYVIPTSYEHGYKHALEDLENG